MYSGLSLFFAVSIYLVLADGTGSKLLLEIVDSSCVVILAWIVGWSIYYDVRRWQDGNGEAASS
jgi:hypothetical protein